MPREELANTLPPEKVVRFIDAYLHNHPEEQLIRLKLFQQLEKIRLIQDGDGSASIFYCHS